jgi:hypothetical protein
VEWSIKNYEQSIKRIHRKIFQGAKRDGDPGTEDKSQNTGSRRKCNFGPTALRMKRWKATRIPADPYFRAHTVDFLANN